MQEALRRILESVFEPHFYEEMMGFRPNRGCHDAIRMLNVMIEKRYTSYVLDADIKSFFNHCEGCASQGAYLLDHFMYGKFELMIMS